MLSTDGAIHGVNLAEGMKEPLVYYQQHPELKYLDATNKGLADLERFDGMPFGLFGADESLHGNDPTTGSELCTAVEMMYTLETLLQISLELFHNEQMSLLQVIDRLTLSPARLLGLKAGTLTAGAPADLVIFHPDRIGKVNPAKFRGKSKNSPFDGRSVFVAHD